MEEYQQPIIDQLAENLEDASINELTFDLSAIVSDSRKYPKLQDSLQENQALYDNMLSVFLKGYPDPYRADFIKKIKDSLAEIIMDVKLYDAINEKPTLKAAYKRSTQMDLTGIEDLLISLTQKERRLKEVAEEGANSELEEFYKKRADYYNNLFSTILVSPHWQQTIADTFVQFAANPLIDETATCLALSALTLSSMIAFDYRKFEVMVSIYRSAQNVRIKERALVGWVFAVCYAPHYYLERITNVLKDLMQDNEVRVELQELQKQIIYCMDAEKDADIMQKDVFSNFPMAKAKSAIILPDDLDESSLDEIIHPEQDDEMAEKMEQSIQKMKEMEKAGRDIYFDGFSKMKNFAFFHTLSNWFMPFYPENPSCKDLKEALDGNTKLLENIQKHSPFCESDKYSFCYAMSTTLKSFGSEPLKKLMKEGILFSEGTPIRGDIENATYVRRMCLQDLFRFFRLAPFRDSIANPFSEEDLKNKLPFFLFNEAFLQEQMSGVMMNVIRFLLKKKDNIRLGRFLEVCCPFLMDEPDYRMVFALHVINNEESYEHGIKLLTTIVKEQPDNILVHKLMAKCYYALDCYEQAAEEYQKANELKPSDTLLLKTAYCWLNLYKHKEALNALYELDYKHPNDANIMRALAWGLTIRGDYAKASTIYNKVEAILKDNGEDTLPDDKFNEGINCWLDGNVQEAQKCFVAYQNLAAFDCSWDLITKLEKEDSLLAEHGITATDRLLMADSVLGETMKEIDEE